MDKSDSAGGTNANRNVIVVNGGRPAICSTPTQVYPFSVSPQSYRLLAGIVVRFQFAPAGPTDNNTEIVDVVTLAFLVSRRSASINRAEYVVKRCPRSVSPERGALPVGIDCPGHLAEVVNCTRNRRIQQQSRSAMPGKSREHPSAVT